MKRYNEEWAGCKFEGMQESPDGEWVRFEDAQALKSLCDELQQRCQSIAALAEIRVRELEAECGTLEHKLQAELSLGWKDRAVSTRLELAQLRERVAKAMELANGRWCEWGERAESVRDAIEEALKCSK